MGLVLHTHTQHSDRTVTVAVKALLHGNNQNQLFQTFIHGAGDASFVSEILAGHAGMFLM